MSRLLREILEAIVLALLVFFVLNFSLQNFHVVGASMKNSLDEGQYLVVSKLAYQRVNTGRLAQLIPFWSVDEPEEVFLFDPPQRGDVIVFHPPSDPDRDFVKRVMGLPGEVLEMRNGVLFVNGVRIDEPYATHVSQTDDWRKPRLPEDQYFVMGDNRSGSNDSRDWGPVPLENIIGKVWLIYWPFSSVGLMSDAD